MIGAEIATIFFLPLAAFNDDMVNFFASFGYEARDASAEQQSSAEFRFLDDIDSREIVHAKVLILNKENERGLAERLEDIRKKTEQRMYHDPRIAMMCRNHPNHISKHLFPLYRRMIEFEVVHEEEPCRRLHCILPEFGLQDSEMATAIAGEGLDDQYVILDRFGDEWCTAAQKLPLSEVEHVQCSMQNIFHSRDLQDSAPVAKVHPNEARSIILFNRMRHCFCSCCSRSLPLSQGGSVQACKRCHSSFYCSLQCYEADFMSHVRFCCKADARRERGVREISLANDEYAAQLPGAAPRGEVAVTADDLANALQSAAM